RTISARWKRSTPASRRWSIGHTTTTRLITRIWRSKACATPAFARFLSTVTPTANGYRSAICRPTSRMWRESASNTSRPMTARGPQFATIEQTERDFREARKLDLPITVHVGDGLWGLNHPIDQLKSLGLLGPRTTYVHCCTLSDH